MFLKVEKDQEKDKFEDFSFWWYCNVTTRFQYTALWRFKWYIHDLIWAKQKWIMDGIGRNWQDKVELLPQVMFNFITHLVEKEKYLEHFDPDTEPGNDVWQEARHIVRDCYNYIHVERPILYRKIYQGDSDGILERESALEQKDAVHMIRIVTWHKYFWT